MTRRRPILCVLFALGGLLPAGPAAAQAFGATGEAPAMIAPGLGGNDWKLGSLPLAAVSPDRTDQIADLHDKFRMGGALVPWLGPYATLKPWLSARPAPDGQVASSGGLLLDVPIGSFTFTPSIGAGYVPLAPAAPDGTLEVRSQLELGYDFDNDARVALGYSHIESAGEGSEGRPDDNVFSFTFRVPFGALTTW